MQACSGLTSRATTGYRFGMDQRDALLKLATSLAAHHGVTHFAISMRALGKGDFFKKLIDGGEATAEDYAAAVAAIRARHPYPEETQDG